MSDVVYRILAALYSVNSIGAIMIYTNVVLGSFLFYCELREYLVIRKLKLQWGWIKLAYAFIGLFWALAYFVLSLLPSELVMAGLFGDIIIRPGITISLSIMVAGAFSRRYRRNR